MPNFQLSLSFWKKPGFLLALILIVFLIKGALFATLLPFLQGFDEDKHFAETELYAEPKEKTWPITNTGQSIQGTNYSLLSKFNISEEEIQTAHSVRFSSLRVNELNTTNFTAGQYGIDEKTILSMPWKKYIDKYPPVTTGHGPLYYTLVSPVARALWADDVFTRFASIRLFSMLFGLLTIVLAYLIARKIGFSQKLSLLIAAILAFQPLFTQTSATINTDNLLTLAFTLFILGGVWMLKDGLNWKNILLIILGISAGIFTKGSALVMLPVAFFLFLYAFSKKLNVSWKKFVIGATAIFIFLAVIFFFASPYSLDLVFHSSQASKFNSLSQSLSKYFHESVSGFQGYELSYWGNFGLLGAPISSGFLYVIWTVEGVSFLGLLFYLFKKDPQTFFRPDKKILIFLLSLTVTLQIGIRFEDWRVFDYYGKIVLKTPGRYFLPTIVCHIILVLSGYLVIFRKEKIYENFVKLVLIFMVLLLTYSVFNVIIPRYYL